MDSNQPDNEQRKSRHYKDLWLQILLPVLLLAVAALGFLIFLIFTRGNGAQSATTWSQIAVIWLIIPALVAGILLFALLLFLIHGLRKFHAWLPPKFHQIGKAMYHLNTSTTRFTEKTTSPVIHLRSKTTGIQALICLISHKKNKTPEER
jgi:hypothetical protein